MMTDTPEERFVTSTLNRRDEKFESSLRPRTFEQFPGQEAKKEQLQIYVQAAKERGDALGHLLLYGPPGLGKTTLAHIIALARDKNIKTSSGPVIEKPGDLAGLLTSLDEGDILFIDEIHRLSTTVEEYLYSAIEDFYIDIILDQGAGSRSIQLTLQPFTLIGATTRKGSISSPLLSRFQMDVRLDYYPAETLKTIVERSAGILGIETDSGGALEIARRSRGTPRVANKLLGWVRDYAQVRADNRITEEVAKQALTMLEIDERGLDEMDRRYLEALLYRFGGGPTGVRNLAVSLGEEPGTLEEVIEPFLIQEGYVMRTPQGRVGTPLATQVLGLRSPPNPGRGQAAAPDLFTQPE